MHFFCHENIFILYQRLTPTQLPIEIEIEADDEGQIDRLISKIKTIKEAADIYFFI